MRRGRTVSRVGCCVLALAACGSDSSVRDTAPRADAAVVDTIAAPVTAPTSAPQVSTPEFSLPDTTSSEPSEQSAELMISIEDEAAALVRDLDRAQIEAIGGQACIDELALIGTAYDRYIADYDGEDPEDVQALVDSGYLRTTPTLWELGPDFLVGAQGSGCDLGIDPVQNECEADYRTIEYAVEAYFANTRATEEPTEQDLIDEGWIQAALPNWDVVAGAPVVTPGSVCEPLADEIEVLIAAEKSQPMDCAQGKALLEAAIEAFVEFDDVVVPSESDLVEAGLLQVESLEWSVDTFGPTGESIIVPAHNSPCTE